MCEVFTVNDILKCYYDAEERNLCKFATLSSKTLGRERKEIDENNGENDIRTPFMRDRDRIIHSKSFRRLMHKTQCFLSPEGDHYRTRLTHTLEVSQIARTISRSLRLNEDLTEAMALGHDLGHTPFGHAGERMLNKLSPEGFSHNEQSLRVVEVLERDGKGLNLTKEVRDGILCHTGKKEAFTPEGRIIKFADRIAYINHDIDDAVRAGVLLNSDIPERLRSVLGQTHSERIDVMVKSIVRCTSENFDRDVCEVSMEPKIYEATHELREFLFKNVYFNPTAKSEETRACDMLKELYSYYCANANNLPDEYKKCIKEGVSVNRAVCDYIAGMTDRYAVLTFTNLFIPKKWSIM